MTARDELKRRFRNAGLDHAVEPIAQAVRPAYRVRRTLAPDEQISMGASKFGGLPDVPADFVWPRTSSIKNPEGMEFVAQIRLADLPKPLPEAAPNDGLLSFFTRWSEGRVFHFPEGAALRRTEESFFSEDAVPQNLLQRLRTEFMGEPRARHAYRAGSLRFEPSISPPDGSSSMVRELKLSDAGQETYAELCEAWWATGSTDDLLKHQMFGHASPIQEEMESECHFRRLGEKPRRDLRREDIKSSVRDWVLLLQLDSDDAEDGPGWMWGDLGMVYFWIHRDDLATCTFDRAIAIEQCH